jgi:hypothetical protein
MKEQCQSDLPNHPELDSQERALHTCWDEIDTLCERADLQGAIRRLGLSTDAGWQEVYEVLGEQERRLWATRLGLAPEVPAEEINAVLQERKRVELASQLRLPPDTTWEELNAIGLVRWFYVSQGLDS